MSSYLVLRILTASSRMAWAALRERVELMAMDRDSMRWRVPARGATDGRNATGRSAGLGWTAPAGRAGAPVRPRAAATWGAGCRGAGAGGASLVWIAASA